MTFNAEKSGSYGTVAFGAYANEAQSRLEYTVMGPVSASSNLDVGFTVDTGTLNLAVYFVGQDSDNVMGTYQGKSAFSGSGAIVDANGTVVQSVVVALTRSSSSVPASTSARVTAAQNARDLVTSYVSTHALQPSSPKPNHAALQSATAHLLNR